MRSKRLRRIDDQLQRIVSEALLTQVQDPRIGFVTVTGVKVSPEFDTAKVYVSVLGSLEIRDETMSGLRSAAPYLQSRIGKAMRLRRIPLLRFLYDDSLDRAFRVDEVLRGVASGNPEDADDSTTADESTTADDSDGRPTAEHSAAEDDKTDADGGATNDR